MMAASGVNAPPSGAVTLLFTDIVGSTKTARALGSGWSRVVADHHRILATVIAANGGYVDHTAGDSFFAVFTDPLAAVNAALEGQRALKRHPWPDPAGPVRVRMGLHTGRVEYADHGYTGL